MMFWHPFWCFSSEVLLLRSPADLPASDRFYCHYRPPERGRSPTGPWSAVRCDVSQHSNPFLVPGRIECKGTRALSQAGFLLFWTKVILPHRSGWIPETAAVYYTSARYQKRWVNTLWKRGITERTPVVHGLLRTPVELGLKGQSH